jgi:hypothetical protein
VPFENSQGITFSFASQTYTATSVSVSRGRGEFDVSSTDIQSGKFRRLRAGKINSVDIKVDWIGEVIPPVKVVDTFNISGTDIGANAFSGKKALCTGLSITGAAGDLVKGSATFKVSQD